MPTFITATRYNNLRTRILSVMGDSSAGANETYGYGNSIDSTTVAATSSGDLISEQQYLDIYSDIVRARVHQIGTTAFGTIQSPYVTGDYVTNTTSTDKIEEAHISYLEDLMTDCENNRFDLHTSQRSETSYSSNSRTTPWNGAVNHEFTVTFADAAARREFFNAGSRVKIDSTQTGDNSTKGVEWSGIIGTGHVEFGYTSTIHSTGYGTASSIGNYDLTSSYQTIWQKTASTYTGNIFYIQAKEDNTSRIRFNVVFDDVNTGGVDGQGTDVDEDVQGTLTVQPSVLRANGTMVIGSSTVTTVSVAAPTYNSTSNL